MRSLALALAVLASLPALAEDKAEIKVNVKKGLKFTRTSTAKAEGKCSLGGGGGGISLNVDITMNASLKSAEEVLDAKSGAPVHVRRWYQERRMELNLSMFGGEQTQTHPLEGADITLGPGDKRGPTAAGSKLDEDLLKKEPFGDPLTAAIASGKVVSVGNTWDADKDKTKEWLQTEFPGFDASEAEMQCKLGEIRDKDGVKCARVEIDLTAKGKIAAQGAPSSDVTITLKGDVFWALDAGIVVNVKADGKIKGDLDVKTMNNGEESKMKIDLTLEWRTSVKTGEADFTGAKPVDKPKPVKPEYYPPPVR
ncbi:MAG: hypothetical protein FD180_4824 [Planctomycetota bacterium]|nr:MAG: hypothetical protein FD180_4824 [Planctomycetota bacterium]